ncbi:unnamed protein product, partial [marine sediment metagenome]
DWNIISDNQCLNSTNADGIYVSTDANDNLITDNLCLDNGNYGINIVHSTCDRNVLENNRFNGNGAGTINDSGTDTEIRLTMAQMNRLYGVTPTAAIWDLDPSSLERCGDGTWDASTGIGNRDVGAWATVGTLTWDMTLNYSVAINMKILVGNDIGGGGDCIIYLDVSYDNTNWIRYGHINLQLYMQSLANVNSTILLSGFVEGRYVRITWASGGGAGVYFGAVYEVQAIDEGV